MSTLRGKHPVCFLVQSELMVHVSLGSYLAAIANAFETQYVLYVLSPPPSSTSCADRPFPSPLSLSLAHLYRMSRSSTYLWILPMFHACGWTYPWAITFAFSTQVRELVLFVASSSIDSLEVPHSIDHATSGESRPDLESSAPFGSNALLRCAYCRGK